MNRTFVTLVALALVALGFTGHQVAQAADGDARVRVVHASPDAPAVDVLVDGGVAFSNAAFKGITDYATLKAQTYNVKVVPTGATEPVVIEADLPLASGKDYTVVALGKLADIEPLVLVDNNATPAAGKAHVRFVHASPDAPAVDVAVAGGPVIFSDIAFKGTGAYTPVDAGSYDLEVRLAGTDTVALAVPGVRLDAGNVYTVFAMGLASGEPSLMAVPSLDAAHAMTAPAMLPKTGAADNALLLLAVVGAMMVTAGIARQRAVAVRA